MSDIPYQNREIDDKFSDIKDALFRIENEKLPVLITQVTKTNGRVTKLERYMLVVACIVGTLLMTSGSDLVTFVMSIL